MVDNCRNCQSRGKPTEIHKQKLLIGEGIEEVRFFNKLLEHMQINDIQVAHYEGKDHNKLSNFLETLAQKRNFHNLVSIGITRDADENLAKSAFDSICGVLKKIERHKFTVPKAINEFSHGQPKIGIFVMPDCHGLGMLEDLCLASITNDPIVHCVDNFLACIETEGRIPSNKSKARIQAWLATHPKIRLLAEAAEAGYWNFEHTAFNKLKDFLQKL